MRQKLSAKYSWTIWAALFYLYNIVDLLSGSPGLVLNLFIKTEPSIMMVSTATRAVNTQTSGLQHLPIPDEPHNFLFMFMYLPETFFCFLWQGAPGESEKTKEGFIWAKLQMWCLIRTGGKCHDASPAEDCIWTIPARAPSADLRSGTIQITTARIWVEEHKQKPVLLSAQAWLPAAN